MLDRWGVLEYARKMEALAKGQAELLDQLLDEIQELERAYQDELDGRPYLFKNLLLDKAKEIKEKHALGRAALAKELEA